MAAVPAPHPAAPLGAPPYTVANAIFICGVNNRVLFNGTTQAERIVGEIFDDDFESCIDKTMKELDEDLKSYSSLTVANGQIRLNPSQRKNVRAFVQWVKDCFRLNENPNAVLFPVDDAANLIRRYKHHQAYLDKSSTLTDTAKPEQFTEKVKWSDWYPTLENFLRAIPGRGGVPLSYVIRPNNVIPHATYNDFIDEYVDKAPLAGQAFATDAAEVHTYIVKFTSGNAIAEAKLLAHADANNGRLDFTALKDHYEGVGVHAVNVVKADKVLNDLFYSGEKPPHMWWDEFERQLTDAFNTYDRLERRAVHSDAMKLRILNRKILADFLQTTKASINLELARVPITMTYENALSAFRNQVNQKFPPEMSSARRTRHINETSTRSGGRGGRSGRGFNRGGRGRGRHGGRSRGGRGYGRSKGQGNRGYRRNRSDARMVRCSDGTEIEVHPAYDFTDDEWFRLPEAERSRITDERTRYKRARTNRYADQQSVAMSEITTTDNIEMQRLSNRISAVESSQDNSSTSGQVSIIGGRNEQANLRSRNTTSDNRSIRKVKVVISSQRSVGFEVDEPRPGTKSPNEMDSNADTSCLGSNFVILSYTQRTADVYPYDSSYEPMHNVPIVTGATVYTDPKTGSSFILIINEGLYYGKKLDHSLFNPNQLRHHGTQVWDNPFDPYRNLSIETEDGNIIELNTVGTKILFETRAPTPKELGNLPHIHLTSSSPWNPDDVVLGCVSTSPNVFNFMTEHDYSAAESHKYSDPSSDESTLHSINPVLVDMGINMKRKLSEITTPAIDDIPARRTFISHSRHKKATAEILSELWCIGTKKAAATIDATTQHGTRSAILPLSRRYRADRVYSLKRLNARFATDTLYSVIKSLNQNTCAHVYTHKVGFSAVYPDTSATGNALGQAYLDFCHDFGVPEHLTFDGATAQVGKKTLFMRSLRKNRSDFHVSSPRRPNENPAEGAIRELKKRWYRVMMKMNVPKRLWDFGLVWVSETGNLSVSSSKYAKGRTSLEYITGETPDISEYLDFIFYDWVVYKPNAGLGDESLGRWLGVSHKVGQLMSYWILPISCQVISCVTVQRLTREEKATEEWKSQMKKYDEKVKEKLDVKDMELSKDLSNIDRWNKLSTEEEDLEFIEEFNRVIDDQAVPDGPDDKRNNETGDPDTYINMEVGLPRGPDNELMHAIVKRRKTDDDGNVIGIGNSNPLLDTRAYEVEYIDGTTETLTANIIAENLLAQVDEEGHRQVMLDEIIDHRIGPEAVKKEEALVETSDGRKRPMRTTVGWEICVQWKDGSTEWVALKDLKQSYPIELADYAIQSKIEDEPVFSWWVPYVQRKRRIILSKVKSKYWQRTHKYGIRIPKSVEEAYKIDEENNNKLWTIGIQEEMKKVRAAVTESTIPPEDLVGYQEIDLHMIFDIKLGENFRRKARMVAGGHKTKPPNSVTYSSVVSRDSVRICLLIAALNELDIQSADIENAYLTAPCRERVWTRAGAEFGTDKGKAFIIVKALYGLKSSGAAFRAFLAERLDEMGFKSSIGDPDVWMRPHTKRDGERYYEYILVYVDDLLAISIDATSVIREVAERFKLKRDKIIPPEIYLGGRLAKKRLNGRDVWTMSSVDYVKAIIKNLEERLRKEGRKLPSRATTPMSGDYRPEVDGTAELDGSGITTYQELIGELRWATEIGRVDILHEVSILSAYQAAPREGHMDQLLHIFAYLKKNPKLTLYFDPGMPKIDPTDFAGSSSEEFREQYRGAKEEIPHNMPEPRGRFVVMTAFVDAAHASDKRTRRSHTGFIIFVNRAPIIFYSKRQSTIESSTFSSEFIALKVCTESIIALRFKLRMFGVPIEGPALVLNDNQSAVNNSSKLESTLNKKHSSIAYHLVRENVAAGVVKVGWVPTDSNIADPLTKRLTETKRSKLFGDWTY